MSRRSKIDSEANFWPVYSDIAFVIVIIMLLFILSQFVISARYTVSLKKEMIRNQNTVAGKFSETSNGSARKFKKGIDTIAVDGNLQLFTFSADVLFEFDRADLSWEGRALLQEFGDTLRAKQELFTRIQIEGHASWEDGKGFDNPEYNQRNWKLSTERALTVGNMFIASRVPPNMISIAGRSYYVPATVKVNASDKLEEIIRQANRNIRPRDKNTNRRINVIIFYSERGKETKILR